MLKHNQCPDAKNYPRNPISFTNNRTKQKQELIVIIQQALSFVKQLNYHRLKPVVFLGGLNRRLKKITAKADGFDRFRHPAD